MEKRTFPIISHALLKEACRVPGDRQTLSPPWFTVLPSSVASQERYNLWICFSHRWLLLKKPKGPSLPSLTEMECKGDCPWKEKLSVDARILQQGNSLTWEVKSWKIFGPRTPLFAFVGKVSLEQAKHFKALCLERRNEKFIDFELERTSEVLTWFI